MDEWIEEKVDWSCLKAMIVLHSDAIVQDNHLFAQFEVLEKIVDSPGNFHKLKTVLVYISSQLSYKYLKYIVLVQYSEFVGLKSTGIEPLFKVIYFYVCNMTDFMV